jgi:hypothetical protein
MEGKHASEELTSIYEDTQKSINLPTSLFNDVNVDKWIFGKEEYKIKSPNKKLKTEEVKWGNKLAREHFGSDKDSNQWTTAVGEGFVKLCLENQGNKVWRPKTKRGFKPDWETKDHIYEVKTRNYCTCGTAGEKILGTPWKYCDIPTLYGKPLKIVLVGFQEIEGEKMGLFGSDNAKKTQLLELYSSWGIEYVKFSEMVKKNEK